MMRGYQERVAAAARQGGNLIVVAPTGAGKTLPIVVHTAHVLERDAAARCVFLAPTQALALQQAGAGVGCMRGHRAGRMLVGCGCNAPAVHWSTA